MKGPPECHLGFSVRTPLGGHLSGDMRSSRHERRPSPAAVVAVL